MLDVEVGVRLVVLAIFFHHQELTEVGVIHIYFPWETWKRKKKSFSLTTIA